LGQSREKQLGQFFTPPEVARTLVGWVVHDKRVRLLDPSCGDGRFLTCHPRSVGIEIDRDNAALARAQAPGALVHEGDFFEWATQTAERFQVAAGNPPFIRYQDFAGDTRIRALAYAERLGVKFSRLTSSWAPFLVAAASLLRPNGRMAFVVPAEIGHATYAPPLLEWLCAHFEHVRVVAFQQKLFPQLSEDAWLLYCAGYGSRSDAVYLNDFERFVADEPLPRFARRVELSTWRGAGRRLRRFLLPSESLALYDELSARPEVVRLSEVGHAGIGYVTGANDFFHVRPSTAKELGIPARLLRVAVRKAEQLPSVSVDRVAVDGWLMSDDPVMLLHLNGQDRLPDCLRRYLSSEHAERAKGTYKCRNRSPWYAVPDVRVPDAFLAYMSGLRPSLVRNDAGCVCTNSVHAVTLKAGVSVRAVQEAWRSPLCELSCELEGHPLGGGMLKLEPGEAANVRLPLGEVGLTSGEIETIRGGTAHARRWRHYG